MGERRRRRKKKKELLHLWRRNPAAIAIHTIEGKQNIADIFLDAVFLLYIAPEKFVPYTIRTFRFSASTLHTPSKAQKLWVFWRSLVLSFLPPFPCIAIDASLPRSRRAYKRPSLPFPPPTLVCRLPTAIDGGRGRGALSR